MGQLNSTKKSCLRPIAQDKIATEKCHSELIKKWTEVFKYYDISKKGIIDKTALECVQEALISTNPPFPIKDGYDELTLEPWRNLIGQDLGGSLSLEGCIEILSKSLNDGNKLKSVAIQYRSRLFDYLDLDNSGVIDFCKFVQQHESFGKSGDPAIKVAFDKIDVCKEGTISRYQFVSAYVDYLTNPRVTLYDLPLFGYEIDPELIRKWKRLYAYDDKNKDGLISKDDFLILQSVLIKYLNLSGRKQTECEKLSVMAWNELLGQNDNVSLNVDQFCEIFGNRWKENTLSRHIDKLRSLVFSLLDQDDNGFVDADEFAVLFRPLGQDALEQQMKVFRMIDTNNDGVLSHYEYVSAYVDYLCEPSLTLEQLPLFGLEENN